MIDHSTIDRIMNAAEISEVVGEFVSLKKRGVNLLGLCPFHNEKTPSFTVSPAKGIYKCFGCGKGGNAVSFLMEHEHVSYPEALKYLAKKYHIEVEETEETAEEIQQKNERESMMVVTAFAQKYFTRILLDHEEGQAVGLSYFKERGYRREAIDLFQLGYSLEARDGFTKEALKNGFKLDYLTKSGLSIQSSDWSFDRFAGRVIFPIHSLSGRVIGFGGRTLRSDKKTAKYLNSPESEIYHKSNSLYGIYFAKNAIAKEDKCYLVEGYTDVLSMHQSGVENVVASSGTSLTEDQVRMIRRFTRNVSIIYDGDEAGLKASLRGIDIILEQGMHVRVVPLPEGEDPDSFAKGRSSSELLEFIEKNEQDFISFKARLLSEGTGNDPVKRANLISEVVRSVAVIPDQIERSLYLAECARILKVEESLLFAEATRVRKRQWDQKRRRGDYYSPEPKASATKQKESSEVVHYFAEEKEIIRMMLIYGDEVLTEVQGSPKDNPVPLSVIGFFLQEFESDPLDFQSDIYRKMFEMVRDNWGKENFHHQNFFTNHPDPAISQEAVDLLSPGYELSKIHAKGGAYIQTEASMLKEVVPEYLNAFRNRQVKRIMAEIDVKIEKLQKEGAIDEMMIMLEQKKNLDDFRKQIAKDLKRII
ncbi:MAG: DNA primase [Bacteroidota bacterium]|nr:DNA primase [Bacteroidota bacterium]